MAASLQAVLDGAVEQGTFLGVGGGAPRFSIPIDDPATNGDNLDGYAFLDAAGCGGVTDTAVLGVRPSTDPLRSSSSTRRTRPVGPMG